ncbi:hypothetical protein ACIQZG_18840 [Lysinibacillus sp. NPDC096418]|uniref:hypothetical protein n=1 Tax=Lysinibacillus sp. NPDC096418 TaxID=3364138 RepID=UPI003812FF62
MKFNKQPTLNELILVFIIIFTFIGASTYYILFLTPKNSLELYQAISFANDFEKAQEHMLEGYEANFKKEDFDFISRLDTSPNRISQFTLFEYNQKSYVIMTTPGTTKLKILAVEELPEDIRDYFLKIAP